ncbi:MAG: thiolase domain-containing protein [Methanobacteriota archaeon]|nr:MAG: thiolase domain-containing protein [Euryarchaeota archaeon]
MKVAVVAAGQTRFGSFPGKGIKGLFIEALQKALDNVDKELNLRDVKEAFIGNLGVGGGQLGNPAALLVEQGGMPTLSARRVENACASSGFAFRDAYRAVKNGADLVLAGGVEVMNDLSSGHQRYWLGVSGDTEWERLAGATFAGIYALMAKRHMHEYNTPREALATCAVKNHRNGSKNPDAQFQKEISLDRVLNAPMVAPPLGLFDCCPTSDGASVVFLASEEKAREITDDPIWIEGSGASSDYLAIHDRKSITTLEATRRAAKEALTEASIEISDVDFAEVHDCFTIAEILAIEDLGIFEKGKAAQPVLDGETEISGSFPINPSGGLKAKGHPLGATGTGQIVELWKQLRGDAGNRQIQGATVGLAHNVGGSGATCAVHILRREK